MTAPAKQPRTETGCRGTCRASASASRRGRPPIRGAASDRLEHAASPRARYRTGTATAAPIRTVPEPGRPEGQRPCPCRLTAIEAPVAATSTSAIRPMPRSIRTTVAASVTERRGSAVSRMRNTSPPMLLGRKLLKKFATRNDPNSVRRFRSHLLRVEQEMPAPRACDHVEAVDEQRSDQPRHRCLTRHAQRRADVHSRKQERKEGEADGEFGKGHGERLRARRVEARRTFEGGRSRHCTVNV